MGRGVKPKSPGPGKHLLHCWRQALVRFPLGEALLGAALARAGGPSPWIKLAPPPECHPTGSLRICRRKNLSWELDLSQWLDWHVFFGLECPEDRLLLSLIRLGDHVLDGGAYIGTVALPAAIRAGVSGRVYCFEPAAENFRKLRRHVEWNRLTQILCFPHALAESTGPLELARPWPENKGGHLIRRKGWTSCPREQVPGLAVDEWAEREAIARLDLVKLDVEGCEGHVLRGARQTLKKHRPILFLESHEPNLQRQGDSRQNLRAEVESLGYRVETFAGNLEHLIAFPL